MFLFATDLMLPGVVVPPTGLPEVQQGDLCAIALVGNRYYFRQLCLLCMCVLGWGGGVAQRNRGTRDVEENDSFQNSWSKV